MTRDTFIALFLLSELVAVTPESLRAAYKEHDLLSTCLFV
jgi:hypothetical protein